MPFMKRQFMREKFKFIFNLTNSTNKQKTKKKYEYRMKI